MSTAAGDDPLAVFRRPRSWEGWGFFVFGLLTFFFLDVLALVGEDLATELLVALSGMVLGLAVAYAIARPIGRFVGAGIWRTLGTFFGLALTFGIVFGGSALAGIPAFPTAQSGNVGALIYSFALGFGVSVPIGLSASGPFHASGRREAGGSDLRTVVLVLGVVAGLFALLLALFVLVEYLVAPLIRHFAG